MEMNFNIHLSYLSGGCSSLLQQLNQDIGDDDIRPRQQSHSPLNNSPPGSLSGCSWSLLYIFAKYSLNLLYTVCFVTLLMCLDTAYVQNCLYGEALI